MIHPQLSKKGNKWIELGNDVQWDGEATILHGLEVQVSINIIE